MRASAIRERFVAGCQPCALENWLWMRCALRGILLFPIDNRGVDYRTAHTSVELFPVRPNEKSKIKIEKL